MRLALFQPDIPQNTGTLLRTAACLGVVVDLIEPCGFVFSEKGLKRAGMDYLAAVELVRHLSWQAFAESDTRRQGRLVLLSTRSATPYTDVKFTAHDILMVGRESAGVPDDVYQSADLTVTIPMVPDSRSLNVAIAAAMVLGEALRQIAQKDGGK
ncbi:MAG TPA: tRNA (cytidine(34)-2'-O)-methyltransferase [Rhodospirillales bacterium]|nr:tRNA (cytidine(34)-2'-O)-methyltransferase [Rhodospirillales bacterium]